MTGGILFVLGLAQLSDTRFTMSGKLQTDDRCRYVSADGRRCSTLRSKGHPSLCPQHRRQQLAAQADPAAVAAELLGAIENFQTAAAVNHALGRLLVLVAGNRIPSRRAATLAYICQLLLTSLPALEDEIGRTKGYDAWEHTVRRALRTLHGSESSGGTQTILQQATGTPGDASAALPTLERK